MKVPEVFRISDPHGLAARKAARVAVVMGAMAILGDTVIDNSNFSTFATFGSFALLSFADFGGPLRSRFLAGLAFGAVGALLITVGTLASGHLAASVAVMAVAAFGLTYLEVLGGQIASGCKGLVLPTVLALMMYGGTADIDDRLTGWALAIVVGSIASVVLWPSKTRPMIRTELTAITLELAVLVRRAESVTVEELIPVRQRITGLRERVDSMLNRPSGPRAKDRALLYVIDESGRVAMFLGDLITLRSTSGPLESEDLDALVRAADVLESTSAVLLGGGEITSISELGVLRDREMAEVEATLDATDAELGKPHDTLIARFDVLFPVRMLTYLALSMSANALVSTGSRPEDVAFEFQSESPAIRNDARSAMHRLIATLRADATPRSRWFRNAVRTALALSAAVAVADWVQLDKSFWIVLGTLSALRSSVADTGMTVLESILGTIGGFVVASLILFTIGDHTWMLWALLPVAIFVATYTAKAVSYPVGQGAFTVMSVVMFNLNEPVGWMAGLVRLHRVGIGVAVAVAAALLLWPRGVSHELAAAVRDEIRSSLTYLRTSLGSVLLGVDQRAEKAALSAALADRQVAAGEFGDLMNSRGTKQVPVETWARLVAQPHALILGGSWLATNAERQGRPATASSDQPAVHAAVQSLGVLTEQLDATQDTGGDDPGWIPDGGAAVADAREQLSRLLDDDAARTSLSDRQIISLLWAYQWLRFVETLGVQLADPVRDVRRALARSWWR